MSKYLERKAKLVAKYNTDIPEITQEQLDWIRDNYDSKAHGNGIDWSVVAYAIDENTLMLRYIVAHKYMIEDLSIEERARMVICADGTVHMFERWHDNNPDDEWKNTKCAYFRQCSHYRYWNRQNWLCRDTQKITPGFTAEVKKVNGLRYIDIDQYLNDNPWICVEDTMKRLISRGAFYEKCDKVGLHTLAHSDFSAYKENMIRLNKNESALLKMLGIDRRELAILKENQSIKCLETLHNNHNMTDREIEFAKKIDWNKTLISNLRMTGISMNKIITYLEKQNNISAVAVDWLHYVDNLKKLNYRLDDSYLFPKDFYREDMRVTTEVVGKNNNYGIKNVFIKKLADAMRKDKAFKEFFAGSNGLIVKVPESAEEIYMEGRRLHNCLATYIDKVAEGKTFIFFVRKMEAPDESYIAMEYRNGQIVQCRYDYNKSVEDTKVINFVNTFAERLRERKVA